MTMTKRQQNLYKNLEKQVEKAFKTNKRQSKSGNERYKNSCKEFAKHLSKNYSSQNFRNIRDKHIHSFVKERKDNQIDAKTIRNDLSAIRKLHSMIDAKHELPKNSELDLPEIEHKENLIDRTWTDEEYKNALDLAKNMQRNDVVNALKLAKNFGVRINETTALTSKQLEHALRDNFLHLENTKNGVPRDVPLENEQQREALKEVLENSQKGRIFIKHDVSHAKAKAKISDWLYNNRHKFEDKNIDHNNLREKSNLTFHGLRHKYARDNFNKNIAEGMTEKQAKFDVSHKLGHGRDAVTNKYL